MQSAKLNVQRLYLQKSYKQLFWEFLKESSIHGLKLLMLFTPVRYAKKLWIVFMTLIIIWTHYIIINLLADFIGQPTEIHMSTNRVHVAQSPFPGVAICSANKISRRKLLDYAEKVFHYQQAYSPGLLARNAYEMSDHLLILKGLYVHPFDNYEFADERLEKLHNILTYMYNTSDYPSREILRDLGQDCENLIVRGMVFGIHINTSNLFYKRMTSSSVCCMFNYHRLSYSRDAKMRAEINNYILNSEKINFESNSILNSVQFVLQRDPSDFTYTELSNDAFQLYIFPKEDYPTIQSDNSGEILIGDNSIVEIPIQPEFFGSSYSIRQFSPRVRKCYFPEEGQQLLNQSYYSIDECLLICRMQSMLRYCGCVSPSMDADPTNATICSLLDLPCLSQWKAIWHRWNRFDHVKEEEKKTEKQLDSSQFERCDHCLPTCDGVDFKIYVNDLTLRKARSEVYTRGLLKGLSNAKPLAIIKLFFKQRFAQATEEDIVSNWVVLLNRFGGIMSLMYGFSIISYIEIFYYLTGKWFMHIYRALKLQIQRKLSSIAETAADESAPPDYELYWQELKPKCQDLSMFQEAVILHSYKRY